VGEFLVVLDDDKAGQGDGEVPEAGDVGVELFVI